MLLRSFPERASFLRRGAKVFLVNGYGGPCMDPSRPDVVFDCNVFLQAIARGKVPVSPVARSPSMIPNTRILHDCTRGTSMRI